MKSNGAVLSLVLGILPSIAAAQSQPVGWGSNSNGQLAFPIGSLLPQRQLALGPIHSLAVRIDGSLAAWGFQDSGACSPPAGVGVLSQVAAGFYHSVGRRQDGTVVCWGSNDFGQAPAAVAINDARSVAAGAFHSVALRSGGVVACWGSNMLGQCNVPAGLLATAVSTTDSHTLALRADGSVRAWGLNGNGQSSVPSGLPSSIAIAAGHFHSMSLCADGSIRCWGSNDHGQCSVPRGIDDAVAIAAGRDHSVALRSDGSLACWGSDSRGQCAPPQGLSGRITSIVANAGRTAALLEDGSIAAWGADEFGQSRVPRDPGLLRQMSLGFDHVLALTESGEVLSWGLDAQGQADVPVDLGPCTAVSAGKKYSVVVLEGGAVRAWGDNGSRQCEVPSAAQSVVSVSAGEAHVAALRLDGSVLCWGRNTSNQCNVPPFLGVSVQVAAGGAHTMARSADGIVRCWGENFSGQCTVPTDLGACIAISAGDQHSVALTALGTVRCWGSNAHGQCQVPASLPACLDVAAGAFHTVALRADGKPVAWGLNASGQCSVPASLGGAASVVAGQVCSAVLLSGELSGCDNAQAQGQADLVANGGDWSAIGIWSWRDAGPQVPGEGSVVRLGAFGSVGTSCDVEAERVEFSPGSSLLVRVDAGAPESSEAPLIVAQHALLAGRVLIIGTGGEVLPPGLDLDILSCGAVTGGFDVLQSTLPPPAGTFLTLVRRTTAAGGSSFAVVLRPLPNTGGLSGSDSAQFDGMAVAAETLDLKGPGSALAPDGRDDLALIIDQGPDQPGRLQVLVNDGQGSLGGENVLFDVLPPEPRCLGTGDVDGDGDDDVVVGSAAGNAVVLLRNNGQGSLAVDVAVVAPGLPLSVVVVPPVPSVTGSPTGGFGAGTAGSGGGDARAATMTLYGAEDGSILDQVAVPTTPTTTTTRGRRVLTGGASSTTVGGSGGLPGRVVAIGVDPSGSLQVQGAADVGGLPVAIDVADIDGDSMDEIVVANQQPQFEGPGTALPVLSLIRDGTSGLGGAVPVAPTGMSAGRDVVLLDADSDGILDIVAVGDSSGGQTVAISIDINGEPGGTLTIGEPTPIDASRPVIAARGNLDGAGGDDLYLVDEGQESLVGGARSGTVVPLRSTSTLCFGDLDGNGSIGPSDLAALLAAWGSAGSADVNRDGIVDGIDLGALLTNWGPCTGSGGS